MRRAQDRYAKRGGTHHYLLGLIQEQRGKSDEAAASFKKAAQALLERSEEE